MKHFYSTAIAVFFFLFSFAAPVNTVIANNGKWYQSSTWSLGRQPIDGDTVVVPVNYTLVIDNNINISSSQVILKIYGSLNLKVGKLDLGTTSIIYVYNGGSINNTNGNNSETIKIGGVTKYSGSDGLVSGPAYASSSTGTAPNGFTNVSGAALPVVFVGFNVARQNNDVLVQWSTAQEVNAARYEVEKSLDGTNWVVIGTQTAAGNTNSLQNYSFTERASTASVSYYRIRQVDIDGRTIYTTVKAIKNTVGVPDVKVAAVTTGNIVLQFNQQVKTAVAVRILSLSGVVVSEQELVQPVGQVVVNKPAIHGNYIISISNNQDLHTHTQILF